MLPMIFYSCVLWPCQSYIVKFKPHNNSNCYKYDDWVVKVVHSEILCRWIILVVLQVFRIKIFSLFIHILYHWTPSSICFRGRYSGWISLHFSSSWSPFLDKIIFLYSYDTLQFLSLRLLQREWCFGWVQIPNLDP